MSTRARQRIGYSTLVLLLLAFIAAIIASNVLLRGLRIDLTENGVYTLAPGTRSILQGIDEPIDLYFYFSETATKDNPSLAGLRGYAARIRETLQEFVARAPKGRLVLHVVDPVQFSEDEDRADEAGVLNVASPEEPLYLGLAGSNSVGAKDRIPVFEPDPRKEAFLEYDLAKLIYNLANPKKVVVGLLSGAPINGGFDPQTQQPSQPWVVAEQARQLFDVRALQESVLRIEDDIDVLWIVHPKNLDDATLYAIDQFVLRGGRALIFVDPLAEILSASDPSRFGGAQSSTLERLFTTWGVNFSTSEVVADNRYGLSIGTSRQNVRHIGLLGLEMDALDGTDVITSGLERIYMGLAGHFTLADGAAVKLTPLLTSSDDAEVLPTDRFQFLADPGELLNDFAATGTHYVLAARLEGPLKSAFQDGPPPAPEREAPVDAALAGQHLASTDNANIVLVGDVDVLSDRLWVQVQSFLGQRLLNAFASNGDFVIGAIDNLSGSSDLIGLRSRATFTRPFTVVEELRREADAKFRATEQRLQAELSETERKLGELQSARNDTSSLIMSPEQQAEVQRFVGEQLRIRTELRNVRRELDASIEHLGTLLKIVNITAVPILLIVVALLVVFLRRRGRATR